MAEVSVETCSQVLQLVAECLLLATEAAGYEIRLGIESQEKPCSEIAPSWLEQTLQRHFGFVSACNCGLALTVNLQTQVLRLGALLDAQAVINALQKGVKPRLLACLNALHEENQAPLFNALEQYFELLCSAVVSSRMT